MKIKDRQEFRSKPLPFTLKSNNLVSDAVIVMADKNIGSVIIVDDNQHVCGIVTERDLLRRLLRNNLDQKTTPLSTIMTTEIKTAYESDDVVDWLWIMSNERFRHLPIINENGKLVNVLSQGDFVSYTWPSLLMLLKEKATQTLFKSKSQLTFLGISILLYTFIILLIFKFIK